MESLDYSLSTDKRASALSLLPNLRHLLVHLNVPFPGNGGPKASEALEGVLQDFEHIPTGSRIEIIEVDFYVFSHGDTQNRDGPSPEDSEYSKLFEQCWRSLGWSRLGRTLEQCKAFKLLYIRLSASTWPPARLRYDLPHIRDIVRNVAREELGPRLGDKLEVVVSMRY